MNILSSLGVVCLLFFLSCTGGVRKKHAEALPVTPGNLPAWAYAPMEECLSSREICASGEGESLMKAEANARASLGAFFKVEVQSQLNTSVMSRGDSDDIGRYREMAQSTVDESVSEILEGVEIRQRFEKNRVYFALAVLDKDKASALLEERLKKGDAQMLDLYTQKKPSTFPQLVQLLETRQQLAERLILLDRQGPSAPLDWNAVMQVRRLGFSPKNLKLIIQGDLPDSLKAFMVSTLSQLGHKIDSEGENLLNIHYLVQKEYLNVQGFEKNNFVIKISHSQDGVEKGVVSLSAQATGRQERQSFSKVEEKLKEDFTQQLSSLNLD